MGKEHLTYFKVENFKRFDSLELTDIGQFNLIVGDNNVGKTSVLEALLFSFDRKKCLSNFHKTLFMKGLAIKPKIVYGPKGDISEIIYPDENFLRYIFKDINRKTSFQVNTQGTQGEMSAGVSIERGNSGNISNRDTEGNPFVTLIDASPDNRYLTFISYASSHENPEDDDPADVEVVGIYEHFFSLNPVELQLPLVSVSLPGGDYLPKSYFDNVSLSRKVKKELVENMKMILPDIEDFEVRKIGGIAQLLIGLKNTDEWMPLSCFGESVIRATQILLEISKYRGSRLMIDEIDTGIHYSRMKSFLKTIFQVAEKNDVQLFMTTHSLECQQAFAEVFEEPDMVGHQSKMRQFSLIENSDGQVVANPHNFEQLQYALEIGFETRGGKRGW